MADAKGRILGIDYGSKRIGVAISDPNRIIAQGLPTIVYQTPPDAFNKIAEIVATYAVSEIVVGLPLTLKGEVQGSARRAMQFAEQLKTRLAIPVIFWDERLTTVIAEATVKKYGKSPAREKLHLNEMAAVLILQSYLDRRQKGIPAHE